MQQRSRAIYCAGKTGSGSFRSSSGKVIGEFVAKEAVHAKSLCQECRCTHTFVPVGQLCGGF